MLSARRQLAPRCPWRAAPATRRVFPGLRSPAVLSTGQTASVHSRGAAEPARARAGQSTADQAKHSAPGVLLPPAACATRRSTTCTAPPAAVTIAAFVFFEDPQLVLRRKHAPRRSLGDLGFY